MKTISLLHVVLTISLVSVLHSPAYALSGETGSDLLEACDNVPIYDPSKVDMSAVYCVNYFMGVMDVAEMYTVWLNHEGIEFMGALGAMNCKPEEANINQIVSVTKKYLEKRPDLHHRPASMLILIAIQDAFCG